MVLALSIRVRSAALKVSLVLLSLLVLELISMGVYALRYGKPFSPRDIENRCARAEETGLPSIDTSYRGPVVLSEQIYLHPYLGFVYPPGTVPGNLMITGHFTAPHCKTNSLGFLGGEDFRGKDPRRFKVLVLGGSVANQFFCASGSLLARSLEALPQLRGRKVALYAVALEAYKQPQQVIGLNYFLSLGGRPDLVINLDGYNEVMGPRLLVKRGIYPLFPERWEALVGTSVKPEVLRSVGRIALARERRLSVARWGSHLTFSVTASLLWSLLDDGLGAAILRGNARLMQLTSASEVRSYDRNGPPIPADPLGLSVQVWSRGSRQIAALARTFGFTYVHALQPTPHTARRKRFSVEENTLGLDGSDKQAIVGAMHTLRQAGKVLAGQVRFVDLSELFVEETETIYVDYACHFNQRGNDLLAAALASAVKAGLSRE